MVRLKPTLSCGLLLLATMFSCSCSSSAAAFPGNKTDRMALLDIKLQMNDPNGFLNSWNDSQHHCQWPGVSCDTRHRRVTALTLRGKTLSGTISPRIGNLSFMKGIHLEENSLHGGIPRQLGQLSRLRFVNLSNNALSGEIPVNLSRCSELIYLDLIGNQLTGKIPAELGFFPKLEFLYLSSNNLTGTIPPSLGNLSSSLTRLVLGYNSLEGYVPNELGLLSILAYLLLGVNKLTGEIPSTLLNISTLISFSAPANFLSGKLPTNIDLNLPNLEVIAISGNHFFGEIPVSITNCTNLEVIDLTSNKFEGKVPPSLGQLLNLQLLYLQGNSFGGNVIDFLGSLTNCTNLRALALSYNNFSGELSNTIGNLSSQLTSLSFGGNYKIAGTIPMEIENLISLETLSLEDNSLTGVIPANLGKLQNLGQLHLEDNKLSGQIPLTLCSNMSNLFYLQLNDNNLVGDLNRILANCRSLQVLLIDGNKLSGVIPPRIFGSYISPTRLRLSSNAVSGTLPLEIGKLANLQELDVSDNKLSGRIPSTIGDCSVIAFIDIHGNRFSGSLPPSLASMKGIEYLDLSDNTLNGSIPKGLNKLIYLKHLNMSYNNLEGEVPTDGVFANASQIMLQGNSKLCGGISELGLPACLEVRGKKKGKKHLKIILIPLLSALVISIILFLYLFLRKKSGRVQTRMPSVPSENMLRVSHHDLYRATSEFSPASLIGSGSFGFVYKGSLVLEHGEIKVVAVKVLDLQKRGASKSFKAECKALSNLRHRNLLPLITYCSSIDNKGNEFKALVYKYMENGSLDMWLHPDQPLEPPRCLDLLQRLDIAIDVALALDHLHNHSHVAVAHCDLKPSNILLDNDLTAYVGDFGLARLLPQLQQGASSSTIAIKGSIGYAAPEYAMGLKVSTEGDVYSYGILLLEMLTGRRPTNDAFTEGLDLHNYVKTGLRDQVWKIVDPSLLSREHSQDKAAAAEDGNKQEILVSVLKLGLGCSRGAAKDRVDMKQVTRELHFIRHRCT